MSHATTLADVRADQKDDSATVPSPVNSRELRALAEYASSFRGKDVYFTHTKTGDWDASHEPPPNPRGQMVVHVHNGAVPDRPRVIAGILLALRSGSEHVHDKPSVVDLSNISLPGKPGRTVAADATFWSEAAVEKFLLPYYSSVYGDRADLVVPKLLNVFYPTRHGRGSPAGSGEVQAFAIAHIPKSEYVTVGGANPGSSGLHVVGMTSDQNVTVVPLEEYPERLEE